MGPCTNCGAPRKPQHGAHGLCGSCYQYRRRNGRDRPLERPERFGQVHVWLPRITIERLNEYAAREGRSASEVVRSVFLAACPLDWR